MKQTEKKRSPRRLAAEALVRILDEGGLSHIVTEEVLAEAPGLDERDRAFFHRLVKTVLERLFFLDHVIDGYSSTPVRKMKPFIRETLRTAVCQLLADLGKILVVRRCLKRFGYGLQVTDLFTHFLHSGVQRFRCTFQFRITGKVFFRILMGGEKRIKGDHCLLVCIVIIDFRFLCSCFNAVAVGLKKFAVKPVFVLLFCILHLLFLKSERPDIPFKDRLDDMTQVGRTLTDPYCFFFFCIVCLDKSRDRVIRPYFHISVLCQRQSGKLKRRFSAADHGRGKPLFLRLLHHGGKNTAQPFCLASGECICRSSSVYTGSAAQFFCHDRGKACERSIDGLERRQSFAADDIGKTFS